MTLFSAIVHSNSLFNVSHQEHVSMFNIKKGEDIRQGDPVVIDVRTLQARKATADGGFLAVGVAKRIVDLKGGNQAVVCTDGYHIFYDPCEHISESDIGKECYFLDADTVTLDGENRTKAGFIVAFDTSDDPVDIEDGTDRLVWVKTDITESEGLEW